MITADDFPRLPSDHGTWAPIYLELLPGSGERITVAVLAQGAAGQFRAHPVLSGETLRCLFGAGAAHFAGLTDLCVNSARDYVQRNGRIDGWTPPLRGATLGKLRRATGDNLMNVLQNAVQLCASLAVLPVEAESDDTDAPHDSGGWEAEIKSLVAREGPDLGQWFSRKVQLSSSPRKTIIGFLSPRYAAGFSLLHPGGALAGDVNGAKAKLWNLQRLRAATGVPRPSAIELIVGHASPEHDPTLTPKARHALRDAVAELTEQAIDSDLQVKTVYSAQAAATYVLARAA